jgi:hypothetical protein
MHPDGYKQHPDGSRERVNDNGGSFVDEIYEVDNNGNQTGGYLELKDINVIYDRFSDMLSKVNTSVNAFGFANGAKTEMMDYAFRTNYSSARTWSQFNNLRASQQSRRITNTLGNTGANYLKGAKALGVLGAAVSTIYTGTKTFNYYRSGGNDWSVYTKAGLDVIMTGVGFMGPVGFGISATYFIIDTTTGGLGGFGQIKP